MFGERQPIGWRAISRLALGDRGAVVDVDGGRGERRRQPERVLAFARLVRGRAEVALRDDLPGRVALAYADARVARLRREGVPREGHLLRHRRDRDVRLTRLLERVVHEAVARAELVGRRRRAARRDGPRGLVDANEPVERAVPRLAALLRLQVDALI